VAPVTRAQATPGKAPLPRARAPVAGPDPVAAAIKALETELATPLPPVPADKEAKTKWLAAAKARNGAIEARLGIVREAWFDGKVSFDAYTALSRKAFDFRTQVARVERSLKDPAPAPQPPAAPGEERCPEYLTPGLVGAMERHPNNPLTVLGAMFLPLTLVVDGMTGLSKLTGACKAPAPPARMSNGTEGQAKK